MSAIAAIFNLDGSPGNKLHVEAMTGAVAHRGPDGIGAWTSGPAGLGACLLKTSPESASEPLPLVSDGGRYAIAFDGRIDNRDELALALRRDEPSARALPDSAVMLAAYRRWGEGCLGRVAGDFAFAVWDAARQELFCARDPVGVRLLHYYCDGRQFIAATEVSQILAVVSADIDPVSLTLFLGGRESSPERTFYEGVKKLPGGCSLTVSASDVNLKTYWDPDPSDLLTLRDDREYEELFIELFKESVRSRLRSRTPTAVSLSGGMDSSSVLATAEHMRRSGWSGLPEVRAYSNVYPGMAQVDESEYIEATVDLYDTPARMIGSVGTADEPDRTSALRPLRAEPYIAPHEDNHRQLFGEVEKDGCRVLLTGLGGDEVFAVGHGHLTDLFRTFDFRAIHREWRYFGRSVWLSAGLNAVSALMPFRRKGDKKPVPWLTVAAVQSANPADDAARWRTRGFRSLHQQDVHAWIQVRGGLPGYTWTDVTAAEYGLEPRHPFMDRRLVEFLVSVPPHLKFRHGYNKRLLRRAMKGILPEKVRNRRYKTNFSSLFDANVTGADADRISDLFKSPALADMGLVDPLSLQQAWDEYRQSPGRVDSDRRTALWAAMTVEQWLRQYVVGDRNENRSGAFLRQRGSEPSAPGQSQGGVTLKSPTRRQW
jgi:asparagine synthase (glutamine-hydrolysing)